MGNLVIDKINLAFEPDEFYALQDIVNQWYQQNHSKYEHFKDHPLIKVASQLLPNKFGGLQDRTN